MRPASAGRPRLPPLLRPAVGVVAKRPGHGLVVVAGLVVPPPDGAVVQKRPLPQTRGRPPGATAGVATVRVSVGLFAPPAPACRGLPSFRPRVLAGRPPVQALFLVAGEVVPPPGTGLAVRALVKGAVLQVGVLGVGGVPGPAAPAVHALDPAAQEMAPVPVDGVLDVPQVVANVAEVVGLLGARPSPPDEVHPLVGVPVVGRPRAADVDAVHARTDVADGDATGQAPCLFRPPVAGPFRPPRSGRMVRQVVPTEDAGPAVTVRPGGLPGGTVTVVAGATDSPDGPPVRPVATLGVLAGPKVRLDADAPDKTPTIPRDADAALPGRRPAAQDAQAVALVAGPGAAPHGLALAAPLARLAPSPPPQAVETVRPVRVVGVLVARLAVVVALPPATGAPFPSRPSERGQAPTGVGPPGVTGTQAIGEGLSAAVRVAVKETRLDIAVGLVPRPVHGPGRVDVRPLVVVRRPRRVDAPGGADAPEAARPGVEDAVRVAGTALSPVVAPPVVVARPAVGPPRLFLHEGGVVRPVLGLPGLLGHVLALAPGAVDEEVLRGTRGVGRLVHGAAGLGLVADAPPARNGTATPPREDAP